MQKSLQEPFYFWRYGTGHFIYFLSTGDELQNARAEYYHVVGFERRNGAIGIIIFYNKNVTH